MAENNAPQNQQDDDLSVDELDQVAGGQTIIINGSPGCGGDLNNVAGCGSTPGTTGPQT